MRCRCYYFDLHTIDLDFSPTLRRQSVTIGCVTENVLHIFGDVLNANNHMPSHLLSNQMATNVQRNGWYWIAQS